MAEERQGKHMETHAPEPGERWTLPTDTAAFTTFIDSGCNKRKAFRNEVIMLVTGNRDEEH
ncbi:hypothetical protein H4Q26_003095 [Puccinia striiformis f. sp. tritici PST-130]|nr:hypothetical protein Pst134EB_012517 [Puccinia striiformis f. sp. tritici]KAI9605122.1 hypothetical protein H4Q26_003095 [Puccinia striiformis f. sp. tritici PST-130]